MKNRKFLESMEAYRRKALYNFFPQENISTLSEVNVEVDFQGEIYKGEGIVKFDLNDGVIFIDSLFNGLTETDIFKIIFVRSIEHYRINGVEVPGYIKSANGKNGKLNIIWGPQIQEIKIRENKHEKINYVYFHLFDFCFSTGTPTLNLKFQDWVITLKPVKNNTLKSYSYNFTTLGFIKKSNKSDFTIGAARRLLEALKYCLSFAFGQWMRPMCPIGYDSLKNKKWIIWSSPNNIRKVDSWINLYIYKYCFKDFFPLFMNLFYKENWNETIRHTIYWYIAAKTQVEVEAKIIFLQAALERLSFEYIVNIKNIMSPSTFENISPASEKLSIFFKLLNIDINIPASSSEFFKKEKFTNAMEALTTLRNSFIHPKNKMKHLNIDQINEIAKMSSEFYILSVLAILEYKGKYQSILGKCTNQKELPWNS